MTIRVLIADDQMMVREGFSVLLNAMPDIEVAGEAVNGREAVDRVRELAPDVVLMDIRMPELNGIEATREIVAADSTSKVLVLIAQGLSNAEIAGRLVVAESTIKTHVSRILVKLGLRDRTQAAVFAYEARLVTPG